MADSPVFDMRLALGVPRTRPGIFKGFYGNDADITMMSTKVGPYLTEDEIFAVIQAINAYDYVKLQQFADNGHDFNTCSPKRGETGLTPLNYVVDQHPPSRSIDTIMEMLEWLVAHGAHPSSRDAYLRTMWDIAATNAIIDYPRHERRYRTQFCELAQRIQSSPTLKIRG